MKYIGDYPHKPDKREYSSAEIDLGELQFVSYTEAKENAKRYVERNQKMKSSCVPSSICNALWLTENLDLAEEPNYRQRQNYPDAGCYWVDQLDLAINFGMAERSVAPEATSERDVNKYEINSVIKNNAKNQRQKSYVFIKDNQDFYKTLNSGYPIVFSIYSNGKEYSKEKPEVLTKIKKETAPIRHAICAIPHTVYNNKGQIGFFITDSAHFGKVSKREITEDFFDKRKNFQGAYFIDLSTTEVTRPQKYKFTRDLTIGDRGEDVLKLQEILQALGYFPTLIKPTGYFGGITRQAVKDFQKDNEKTILWTIGLKTPTGYFGKQTRSVLEKIIQ